MSTEAQATAMASEAMARIKAKLGVQATPAKEAGPVHTMYCLQLEEDVKGIGSAGDTIIRIPQRIPVSAVREAKTDKKTPFVYCHPRNVVEGAKAEFPVVLFDENGDEFVATIRLGGTNVFFAK